MSGRRRAVASVNYLFAISDRALRWGRSGPPRRGARQRRGVES